MSICRVEFLRLSTTKLLIGIVSSMCIQCTNIDNTSDADHYDYDYVDYFQDDSNTLIHTSDYDAAREGNNYNDMDI